MIDVQPGMRHRGLPVLGVALLSLVGAGAGQQPKAVESGRSEASSSVALVGNRAAKTYHRATCALATRLPARSKLALADAGAALKAGLKPCPMCDPDGADAGEGAPATPAAEGSDRKLVFSRDIAPILVGNCLGCHNADQKRGELNLTTFAGLQSGSKNGAIVVPGKPEESILVQMVVERKMPRGGNRRLSDEAIEKIGRWVAEGALYDGADPMAALEKVAPTPETLRRESLASMPVDELDKKTEAAGRERLAKAIPGGEPKLTVGRSFLVLGELPEDRVNGMLRVLDGQKAALLILFGPEMAKALNGPEKISVYVLKDDNAYSEFVRGIEQREAELGAAGHARLGVESPYVVVVDPLAGAKEPPAVRGRGSRRRGGDPEDTGPERSLAGLAVEHLTAGTVQAAGQPPRWLVDGLGALAAVKAEGGGAYQARLRNEAVEQFRLGWVPKATDALGDQGTPEAVRAIGYSLCDCLAATAGQAFGPFVREMTKQGGAKLDDIIKACFGPQVTREQFLQQWGGFIAQTYVGRRR